MLCPRRTERTEILEFGWIVAPEAGRPLRHAPRQNGGMMPARGREPRPADKPVILPEEPAFAGGLPPQIAANNPSASPKAALPIESGIALTRNNTT